MLTAPGTSLPTNVVSPARPVTRQLNQQVTYSEGELSAELSHVEATPPPSNPRKKKQIIHPLPPVLFSHGLIPETSQYLPRVAAPGALLLLPPPPPSLRRLPLK